LFGKTQHYTATGQNVGKGANKNTLGILKLQKFRGNVIKKDAPAGFSESEAKKKGSKETGRLNKTDQYNRERGQRLNAQPLQRGKIQRGGVRQRGAKNDKWTHVWGKGKRVIS